MKVLAKRANGIFIIAPIIMTVFIIFTICIVFMLADDSERGRAFQMFLGYDAFGYYRYRRGRFFRYFYWGCLVANIGTLVSAVRRLLVPKVIMEYDNCGVYIYRRFKPVQTVRYEDMRSRGSAEDLTEVEVVMPRAFRYGTNRNTVARPFGSFIKTGKLTIETADDIITLYGVKNVEEVNMKLDKLIKDSKKKNTSESDIEIAKQDYVTMIDEMAKYDMNK